VDVGEEPELKEELLQGQVNYAECPQCGMGGILSAPLVYHDPEKELLITYVPSELGMSADEQEKYVGSLVNAVMNNLPAEQRKSYFFQPKTALTMESLFDMILEAEGISKEVLESQRAKLRMLSEFVAAVDDQERLDELIEEHREELDYTFFLLLSDMIDAQKERGDEESTAQLQSLREKLLEQVSPAMPTVADEDASYDDLIEMLQEKEAGDTWRTTIALNRMRLDYGFFQHLTNRIDAAESSGDTETVEKLTKLRERILGEIDAQDQLVREAEDEASLLIMQLSEAEDLDAAIREHQDELDQVFISVLARYESTARSRGNAERAAKLHKILETALAVIEERLPADLRLINRLLRAEHPEETDQVLEEHRGMLNDEFVETYDRYVSQLEEGHDEELVEHMSRVREQIVAKMTVLRG
jgi:hypothetical protein